jgi:hypothetical protein
MRPVIGSGALGGALGASEVAVSEQEDTTDRRARRK